MSSAPETCAAGLFTAQTCSRLMNLNKEQLRDCILCGWADAPRPPRVARSAYPPPVDVVVVFEPNSDGDGNRGDKLFDEYRVTPSALANRVGLAHESPTHHGHVAMKLPTVSYRKGSKQTTVPVWWVIKYLCPHIRRRFNVALDFSPHESVFSPFTYVLVATETKPAGKLDPKPLSSPPRSWSEMLALATPPYDPGEHLEKLAKKTTRAGGCRMDDHDLLSHIRSQKLSTVNELQVFAKKDARIAKAVDNRSVKKLKELIQRVRQESDLERREERRKKTVLELVRECADRPCAYSHLAACPYAQKVMEVYRLNNLCEEKDFFVYVRRQLQQDGFGKHARSVQNLGPSNCGKSIALCGLTDSHDGQPLFMDEEVISAPVCRGDFPVAAWADADPEGTKCFLMEECNLQSLASSMGEGHLRDLLDGRRFSVNVPKNERPENPKVQFGGCIWVGTCDDYLSSMDPQKRGHVESRVAHKFFTHAFPAHEPGCEVTRYSCSPCWSKLALGKHPLNFNKSGCLGILSASAAATSSSQQLHPDLTPEAPRQSAESTQLSGSAASQLGLLSPVAHAQWNLSGTEPQAKRRRAKCQGDM